MQQQSDRAGDKYRDGEEKQKTFVSAVILHIQLTTSRGVVIGLLTVDMAWGLMIFSITCRIFRLRQASSDLLFADFPVGPG